MATKTANALGTERQFAPQPKDVYQKQLIVPSGKTSLSADETKAGRLARALGIASDTLGRAAMPAEERWMKYGKWYAEMAERDPKNADKIVASSQQMLANAGLEKYVDNPYAIAELDRYRGQNALRDIHNRYQDDVVSKEGVCLTADEEAKRWQNYVQEHIKEYNYAPMNQKATEDANVDGTTAPNSASELGVLKPVSGFRGSPTDNFFNDGFYENYPTYSQNVVNAQREEAANNRDALRSAGFTANLSALSSPEYLSSHTVEDFQNDLKRACMSALTSGMQIRKMVPILAKFADEVVSNHGSADLEKMFDTEVYVDGDQKSWKLKDLLPYETYHGAALKMDLALREKDASDMIDKLSNAKSLEEFKGILEDTKKNNPHMYTSLAQSYNLNSMIQAKKDEIEREQRRMASGRTGATGFAISGIMDSVSNDTGMRWVADAMAGKSYSGVTGAPITMGFKVTYTDSNGNVKQRNATADDYNLIGKQVMSNITQKVDNGQITLEDAVNQQMSLFSIPQMSKFRDSYRGSLNNTLLQSKAIDWDNLDYSNGNVRNVQLALDMYRANRGMARLVLGNELFGKISGIASLFDTANNTIYHNASTEYPDGLKEAMKNYGNTALYLSEHGDTVDKEYWSATGDYRNLGMNIDAVRDNDNGAPSNVEGINYMDVDWLKDNIYATASQMIAGGMSGEQAISAAEDAIKGGVCSYEGVVFPKDVTVGVNEDATWQLRGFSWGLRAIREELSNSTTGYVPTFRYDDTTNSFVFNTEDKKRKSYTVAEVTARANEEIDNRNREEQDSYKVKQVVNDKGYDTTDAENYDANTYADTNDYSKDEGTGTLLDKYGF